MKNIKRIIRLVIVCSAFWNFSSVAAPSNISLTKNMTEINHMTAGTVMTDSVDDLATGGSNFAVYKDVQPGTAGTLLSNYMKTVYKTSLYPELDPYIYRAFDLIEQNQTLNDPIVVYTAASKDELLKFRNYFNGYYGFTHEFRVTGYMKNNNTYLAVFNGNGQTPQLINEYYQKVNRVQTIANALKGNSDDNTVENIMQYIHNNIQYDLSIPEKDKEEKIKSYYAIFDTNKTICYGFSLAVHHLAAMNGIPSTLEKGYYTKPDGAMAPHAWNTIFYHGSMKFCDTTGGSTRILDTVPKKYVKFS